MALGAVILVALVATGACLVTFVTTGADPEVRVAFTAIEPGVPRFEPITNWGADDSQATYGIWIAQIPGTRTRAYLSREVNSGCHLTWEGTERVGDVTGIFRDRCNGGAYDINGNALDGPTTRNLDQFPVDTSDGDIRVDFSVLQIGTCRVVAPISGELICAPEIGATTRTVPRNGNLPDDFARR
jgi:hypothetical protein